MERIPRLPKLISQLHICDEMQCRFLHLATFPAGFDRTGRTCRLPAATCPRTLCTFVLCRRRKVCNCWCASCRTVALRSTGFGNGLVSFADAPENFLLTGPPAVQRDRTLI